MQITTRTEWSGSELFRESSALCENVDGIDDVIDGTNTQRTMDGDHFDAPYQIITYVACKEIEGNRDLR